MAYLTLDADVKDDFVQDIPALQAMFEMAKASRALASGLRRALLDSGSQGLPLSLGKDPCVLSPAVPSTPWVTWISHLPLSHPPFT